jgi:twitching motility protein PilT
MNIDDLLQDALGSHASDLHLTVGVRPTIRVWGELIPMERYPILEAEDTWQLARSMMDESQKKRFDQSWEMDLSYSVQGVGRFRVNVYKQRGAVGAALRAIPRKIPAIEDLNLPAVLADLARRPRGLILVTGPAGQGKSTTLAAMVDRINEERSAHIVTVEDPIEYLHEHKRSIINQRELGLDTLSFPAALRAALREDPNVVLIGEMRDLETISAALTIAETGHLVLATLHTANAAQSIDRIIDVFSPHQQQQVRIQLASVLEAVVSQILLPARLSPARLLETAIAAIPGLVSGSGAAGVGRVPAVEVMIATSAIRNLIREAKSHQIESAIQTGAQYGMQTMDQSLRHLCERGLISFEDAIGKAMRPDELRKMIAGFS